MENSNTKHTWVDNNLPDINNLPPEVKIFKEQYLNFRKEYEMMRTFIGLILGKPEWGKDDLGKFLACFILKIKTDEEGDE